MSIKFIDNLTLDIYIIKDLIKSIDFNKKEELEKYIKKLFKTLKYKYNVEINGFYDITVYRDKYYGVIFHLEKEDLDYYDCFKNQVDMKLIIVDAEFVYQVDDIPKRILDKIKIIVKDDNIYLKIKEELNKLDMMLLLENSRLVYDFC